MISAGPILYFENPNILSELAVSGNAFVDSFLLRTLAEHSHGSWRDALFAFFCSSLFSRVILADTGVKMRA
jgi:hypothetical protein